MEPLLQRLESETGLTFRRFEVWYNLDNLKLLQTLDQHNACGGVPYFYNKKTRGWICGATTYANFKAFATGRAHEHFLSPPVGVGEGEGGGWLGGFKGFWDKIKSEGLEKIRERFEEGKRKAGDVGDGIGKKVGAGAFVVSGNGGVRVGNQVAKDCLPVLRNHTRQRRVAARLFHHSLGQPF